MALIDNREFLKWLGLYVVIAGVVVRAAELLPAPTSPGWAAAVLFGYFFFMLTVALPLIGVFYSALFQSFRSKKWGWFFLILFLNFLGAYLYAFCGHETKTKEIAA